MKATKSLNNWRKPMKELKKTNETIEESQGKGTKINGKVKKNNEQMEKTHENMKKNDGLKTRMPDATEVLKGVQNMTHLECPIYARKKFRMIFLVLDFFNDAGIPSACDDNFVAPHFHTDFSSSILEEPYFISSPVFWRHSKWTMEIQMVHHTLESWKHQGHQSNMTKTWQKRSQIFWIQENETCQKLVFFLSCFSVIFLSFSCHCLSVFQSFLSFSSIKATQPLTNQSKPKKK